MAYAIKINKSGTNKKILVALFDSPTLKNGTSWFATKGEAQDFINKRLSQKILGAKIVKFPKQ